MSTATLIMVCLICLGCALGIAGLAYLGYSGYRLLKAARKVGITSADDLALVMRRVQELAPRVRELEKKQKVVAERLKSLSATTGKLNYLRDELDRATGSLTRLKF